MFIYLCVSVYMCVIGILLHCQGFSISRKLDRNRCSFGLKARTLKWSIKNNLSKHYKIFHFFPLVFFFFCWIGCLFVCLPISVLLALPCCVPTDVLKPSCFRKHQHNIRCSIGELKKRTSPAKWPIITSGRHDAALTSVCYFRTLNIYVTSHKDEWSE